MESFDLLSSHFDSSFSALSTAFARHGMKAPSPLSELRKPKSSRRGYLALLVGSSVGTAKAKVILGLDGLESKVWGLRDDEAEEEESEEESDDGAAAGLSRKRTVTNKSYAGAKSELGHGARSELGHRSSKSEAGHGARGKTKSESGHGFMSNGGEFS